MTALLRTAALFAATMSVGVMAGLFFGFACAVMPGLARVDDRTFVAAFQQINIAIVNGWFLLVILGSLVFAGIAAGLSIGTPMLWWVLGALVLYLVSLGITVRGNIPLNNMLAAVTADDLTDLSDVRRRFERPWNRLHLARTVATLGALACLVGALLEA